MAEFLRNTGSSRCPEFALPDRTRHNQARKYWSAGRIFRRRLLRFLADRCRGYEALWVQEGNHHGSDPLLSRCYRFLVGVSALYSGSRSAHDAATGPQRTSRTLTSARHLSVDS